MSLPKNSLSWQFAGACTDGQCFKIDDINVWKYPWQQLNDVAQVKDPHYGQDFSFSVYQIEQYGKVLVFAAGEFSNNVWGFYTRSGCL